MKITKKADIPDYLKEAFRALDKMNTDSVILSENAVSIADGYLDTGSMALNAIISASLYGGIPRGRITGLCGPTGSGKSLILNKIIGKAQQKDPAIWGMIWDSENASEPQMAINVGANPDQIKVSPVATVEQCRNEIATFLDSLVPHPQSYGKTIIGIDSLGNLASAKEIADAEKGKDAVDMGMRAKAIKSMMRVLSEKCRKTKTTLIYTNHIYDDPGSMYQSMIKSQAGGKGPLYLSSLIIQLSVTPEKVDAANVKEVALTSKRVTGVNLKPFIVKNRFIPPFSDTELYLNFKTGFFKYSGLLEIAEAYGVVKREGNRYISTKTNEMLGFKKAFMDNNEIWEKNILPDLEVCLKKDLVFNNESDDLEEEVNSL